jgi:hypothetical protein
MLGRRAVRWERLSLALPAAIAVLTWLLFVGDRRPGTAAALQGFPLDDAWIHLVYARNLAEHGGFYYNDGQPETGMTSPLWVVVMAGVYALTPHGSAEPVVLGAKLCSLAFGVAAVVVLYGLVRTLGERPVIALLAASLAAADPSLTFARAAGMEVSLFILLSLSALHKALRGRVVAAGCAAGLSVVARPEGIVLFPLLFLLLLRRDVRSQPGFARSLVLAGWLAGAPALAYSGFCLYATGAPLPNTFYAKFAVQNSNFIGGLLFGWRHYVHDNLSYFTAECGGILALLGAYRIVRRAGSAGLGVVAAGVLLFAAPLSSRSFAPGHYFYWERWLIPSFPFLIIAMASGVAELADGLPAVRSLAAWVGWTQRSGSRLAPRMWAALACGACAVMLVALPRVFWERSGLYAWNAQNIEEMNVALGRWIDAHLPPDAVIAVVDAGALRYFGRRTTYDFFGLNTHALVRRSLPERLALLEQLRTSHVVAVPGFFSDEVVRRLALEPTYTVRAANYTICDAPQDVMTVYQRGGSPAARQADPR